MPPQESWPYRWRDGKDPAERTCRGSMMLENNRWALFAAKSAVCNGDATRVGQFEDSEQAAARARTLGAMVLVGVSHSTFEMFRRDDRYTALIDEMSSPGRSVVARGLCHKFNLVLYREIARTESGSDASGRRRAR